MIFRPTLNLILTGTLSLCQTLYGCSSDLLKDNAEQDSQPLSPIAPAPTASLSRLILGNRALSPQVQEALLKGDSEEKIASDPRTAVEEGLLPSVSMERHKRRALADYTLALDLLSPEMKDVRRRIEIKIRILEIGIDRMVDINRRLWP